MPDNGQSPENEFDRRLEDLGDHVEYPPTPDLAASVREGLQGKDRRRPSLAGWVAAAVVVLISLPVLAGIVFSGGSGGGGAVGSSSNSGDSGGGGAAMESADAPAETTSDSSAMKEETPADSEEDMIVEKEADQGLSESAGETATSTASPGAGFGFGEGIPFREARELSDPPLLLPTSSEYKRPDEIYVGRPPNQDDFVLVYAPREALPQLGDSDVGAILTEPGPFQ